MRQIKEFGQFWRDLRRESRGKYRLALAQELPAVIDCLRKDEPLEPRHRDHALMGQWHTYRDCHIRPDLILIYSKPDPDTLVLVRLGTHSELGL